MGVAGNSGRGPPASLTHGGVDRGAGLRHAASKTYTAAMPREPRAQAGSSGGLDAAAYLHGGSGDGDDFTGAGLIGF